MAHVLIVGQTESGKTTAARRLALEVFRPNNFPILVLDEFLDPAWQADWITDDPQKFMRVAFLNRSCALFVDEGSETIGRYAGTMKKLATQARHWGHCSHFITQAAVDIDKTIRRNCSAIFLFNTGLEDCKELRKNFVCDTLLDGPTLRQGEYIYFARFGQPVRGNIFEGKPL